MKAKLIKEYLDPTKGGDYNQNFIDWEDNGDSIIFKFENDGMIGYASVDVEKMEDFFGTMDFDNDQIEEYVNQISPSDIEWEEDEGPNPDEMRDFRDDR